MKQALVVVKEIKRMEKAIHKTESYRLRNDYRKGIERLKSELKEYCRYKNLNYRKLLEHKGGRREDNRKEHQRFDSL